MQTAHFDLYRKLIDEPAFEVQLRQTIRVITGAEQKQNHGVVGQSIRDILRMCAGNFSLLIPYYFPQFSVGTVKPLPLSTLRRPFLMPMQEVLPYSSLTLRGSRQIGKEQPYSAPILTPTGWTTMGALKKGDLVFGRNGHPCRVTGIFEQGLKDVYRMTFTDGSSAECGLEHRWMVRGSGHTQWQVKSLDEILRRGACPRSDDAYRIPLTEPIQFPKRAHWLDPYVLGVLLGDGCLHNDVVMFSTADAELLERVRERLPAGCGVVHHAAHDYRIFTLPRTPGQRTPLRRELDRLGVYEKFAHEKFVPSEYLFSSVENRLELLRGLMDTDGSIYGKCQMEFYSSSQQLAKDVQFLVQSLGGTAEIKIREKTPFIGTAGEKKLGLPCHRVKIKLKDINPFWLPRKASRFYSIRYERTRIIESILATRQERSRCIMVDSIDHTYLTSDCLVTHNTIGAVSRLRLAAHLVTNHRAMYIAPYTEHIKTFANKFREMERKFRFPVRDTRYRQNLYYKEYPNGASIEVLRILTSAADARGKTIDDLFFDEFQDFDAGLLAEVMQIQRASRRPSLVKSGTSKTMDTPLEIAFQESSQGYWHVRSGDGRTYLNCGDPKTALAILQKSGPTCPITSRPLNMLDGFFVHAYPDRLRDLNIGLHLPQLIVQDFVRDPNEWNKIWNYYTAFGTARTLTEVLGIPMAEGSREITREHLQATCVLPEPDVLMKRAQAGYYPYIASGLDWGGSDYNEAKKTKLSYTAHVILGQTGDGRVDILHMRDYAGMDYEEIAYLVMQDHKRYCANGLASDFGGGSLYHHLLRRHSDLNPNRHFILQYRPPNEAYLEPLKDCALFNAYGLNRTESITRLFMALRDVPQEIRCFPWHLAEKYLEQCLNLYRTPCESFQPGRNFFKYHRHGAKPDDILHAMNFGYTMLRILRGDRLAVEPMVHREIVARLGRTSPSHNTGGLRRAPGRAMSG